MAKLTKADAARHLGIARSTLYKLIDQGKVSPTPDGLIDQAELVRVAAYVDTVKERTRTGADVRDNPVSRQVETPYGRPQDTVRGQPWTDTHERPQTSADVLVDVLREQLHLLRDELQEARQSAQAARDREALLLQMLRDMQQRYDRLLEAPRPAPPPVPQVVEDLLRRRPYAELPEVERPQPSPLQAPNRHARRQRILEALAAYPEGLHWKDIARLIGDAGDLNDTLQGMLRYQLVRRVGRGVYALPVIG